MKPVVIFCATAIGFVLVNLGRAARWLEVGESRPACCPFDFVMVHQLIFPALATRRQRLPGVQTFGGGACL